MRITFVGIVTLSSFVISILFCIISWIMTAKKNEIANWASTCSLSFVVITLLMEYRAVLEWIQKEDWTALIDVVPSTFSMLCGYIIIMILANGVLMIKRKSNHKV